MSHVKRRALIAAGGILMAGWAGRKLLAQSEDAPLAALVPTEPPLPLPDLAFRDDNDQPCHLSDYKGQGVVLNCWATWCHPCVVELPSLDRLCRDLQGQHIAVLALSSDRGGAAAVRSFYASHGIGVLAVLLDPDMAVAHQLGVRGIPTTLLIDPQGRERARLEGAANWSDPAAISRIRALIGPVVDTGIQKI